MRMAPGRGGFFAMGRSEMGAAVISTRAGRGGSLRASAASIRSRAVALAGRAGAVTGAGAGAAGARAPAHAPPTRSARPSAARVADTSLLGIRLFDRGRGHEALS